MFNTKYKLRIKELEYWENINNQRINNQCNMIDGLLDSNKNLQAENTRASLERLNESRILTSLKKECLEKAEQINTLQEIVNNRNAGGEDNVDELKRTIEKQAGEIGRLEAFKKRIQQKKKLATDKKAKNKK